MGGTSQIEVFRADGEDADGIAAIHARSREVAYRDLPAEARGVKPSIAARVATWRELLTGDDDANFTLVAEVGGTAAGFCSLATVSRDADRGPRTGEIAALYVDPPRWRQGVGSALIMKAVAELREAGCDAATLWILAENGAALRFYARHGFDPDGFGGPDPRTGRPKARLHASLAS